MHKKSMRVVGILAVAAMSLSMLAACGPKDSDSSKSADPGASQSVQGSISEGLLDGSASGSQDEVVIQNPQVDASSDSSETADQGDVSVTPDQGDVSGEEAQGDVSEAPDQGDVSVEASQPNAAQSADQANAETANG